MLLLGPKATLAIMIAAQVEPLAAWAPVGCQQSLRLLGGGSSEELANHAHAQQALQYVPTKTAGKLPATLKILLHCQWQDRSPACK
jgi:hypothetical protein